MSCLLIRCAIQLYKCNKTSTAVRFLTRTFRNIFYVRVGKLTCGVCSARERSFEEAGDEMEVGRRLLPPPLDPEPRPPPPRQYANRTPTTDLCGCYFAWNWTIPVVMLATVVATTATLSSNSCNFFYAFYFRFTPRTIRFLGKQTLTSERWR